MALNALGRHIVELEEREERKRRFRESFVACTDHVSASEANAANGGNRRDRVLERCQKVRAIGV